MKTISLVLCSVLLSSAHPATQREEVESRTAFFGEDVELLIPSLKTTEVLFKPGAVGSERVLMSGGVVNDTRVKLNDLHSHLILEKVGEDDEGMYIIQDSNNPEKIKHLLLNVRDCSNEQNVKYGEHYNIPLSDVSGPITLEFRSSFHETNDSAGPPLVLLNQSWTPVDEYKARLSASEHRVSLHGVTGSDEGSYAVLDSEMKVRKKMCLNVKEHQYFELIPYGGTLKIKLFLDHSKVNVVYIPEYEPRDLPILSQGQLVEPADPSLEGRLSVEGSMCILERVRGSDKGLFKVTDLQGFPISNVHLDVEPYKLPSLYVAIISLVSLLVFLLLLCLFSCLVKVHRRAEKAKAIAKIAQEAGKEEGEAFRQVVQEAYVRFAEESSLQSQSDNNTLSTEVDIKGLEVSKSGHYKTLSPDKNNLEMSDSGVEFNSSCLPMDSDTDVPQTYTSNKILLESDFLKCSAVPEANLSAGQTPDSLQTVNGTPEFKLSLTPEPSAVAPPEADLMCHAAAEAPSKNTGPPLSNASAPASSGELAPAPEVEPTSSPGLEPNKIASPLNDKTVAVDLNAAAENATT